MTTPTTPSPERQPADAGGEEARRNIQQLAKMQREQAGWANKIGQPGCGARLEASDNAEALAWAVKVLTAPAPQAQPDARAWLVQEFNHDGVLRSEFAVVGDQPWSGERGADQITTQPLYLSAPAADDGWRDKAEGLESDLRSAVQVAWRRGAKEWARLNYPQWVEWLEACDALSQPEPSQ